MQQGIIKVVIEEDTPPETLLLELLLTNKSLGLLD